MKKTSPLFTNTATGPRGVGSRLSGAMRSWLPGRAARPAVRCILAAAVAASGVVWSGAARAQLATRHYLPPVPGFADSNIEIEISTPSTTPVSYRVFSRSGGLVSNDASIAEITGTVVRGTPTRHSFSRAGGNNVSSSGALGFTRTATPTALDDFGIVVEASTAVTVTMYQLRSNNRDIIASKGSNAIGQDFYLWSAANTTGNAVGTNHDSAHFFSIMALENATTVNLTSGSAFAGYLASEPITLNAFQTFTVRTTTNASISGSRLSSDKPITVLSGDVHPAQQGRSERDGGVDQLVSVTLAGTQYVVGNIADSLSYGLAGQGGVPIGNRYVQVVGTADGTQITWFRSDTAAEQSFTVNAGQTVNVHLPGTAGTGHYFRSTNDQPFLLFLNSSGDALGEMGGAAIPALRGSQASGTFCSGTNFVEFTAPAATQSFLVYVPTADLGSLQVDVGAGLVPYSTPALSASVTAIDPDGAGGIDAVSFVRFPGSVVATGARIAFQAPRRMHVAVGTSVPNATGSFGYFSDYNIGFLIQDPLQQLPTDRYPEPQTFANADPRTIRHCVDVDSACSEFFGITSIASSQPGTFANVTTISSTPGQNPCFDFTPTATVGVTGSVDYVVALTVTDENGDRRNVEVVFTYEWPDSDGDGVPDEIDLDDDNDGLTDLVELGGADLSRDTDADGVADWKDTDFVTCASTDGDECNTAPTTFDSDGDGIPNHLDVDSDGDGVDDLIEGHDANENGVNDNAMLDADSDGRIDTLVDTNENGVHDAYEIGLGGTAAAVQDTDDDGAVDYLDADDDGDGVPTSTEDVDGDDNPADDDTDGDGKPNYLDRDDDNDGILTRFEDVDEDGDPTDDDTDGTDGPNYLDADDDGDGILTTDEDPDPNGNGDPADAVISDGGVVPDYLNPLVAPVDTDGDGIPDFRERPNGTDRDTDADGTPDHLDADDDGDGVLTRDERPFGDRDTDDDGTPDHLDTDDDGDGIPTRNERPDGDDVDSDGDGIPNHLEPDDDGDGIPTRNERPSGRDRDSDSDGRPDHLDTDDDNDGVLTRHEDVNGNGDPRNDDTDGDGTPNYLDTDDDDDGLLTKDEDVNGDGDSRNDDTDSDGTPNYLDPDDDDDGIPTKDERPNGRDRDTDDDGNPDHLDADDDGDGIPTRDESPRGRDRDSDRDGTPDRLDDDDDGDGVPTRDEQRDSNGNGVPDYLEDGDGVAARLRGGGFGCSVEGALGANGSGPTKFGFLGALVGLALMFRRRTLDARTR